MTATQMLSSITTMISAPLPRAGGPMPHLRLSAVARSAPPVLVLIRRRCSTHLRSHDTVPPLHFLGKVEARKAISPTMRLRGALRRSIHEGTAMHEEAAERPDLMGAWMRGRETCLTRLCTIVLFLVMITPSGVGCGFVWSKFGLSTMD